MGVFDSLILSQNANFHIKNLKSEFPIPKSTLFIFALSKIILWTPF